MQPGIILLMLKRTLGLSAAMTATAAAVVEVAAVAVVGRAVAIAAVATAVSVHEAMAMQELLLSGSQARLTLPLSPVPFRWLKDMPIRAGGPSTTR